MNFNTHDQMDQASKQSPFYLRFGITVITLAILAAVVHLGRAIFIPVFFGILLATLLLPAVRFLQAKGLGKTFSIAITLCVAIVGIAVIFYFLSVQVGNFLEDIPTLEKKLKQLIWQGQKWVHDHFNIGFRAQNEYLDDTTDKMKTPEVVGKTVLSLTGIISYIVFLPIYTFLILYHKDMIRRFLTSIFRNGDESRVRRVLTESQQMSQQYITGLLTELCIVFALNTFGFFLLGIKYPVFLGLIAALLNIVPYIGMIIANILCVLVTLMTAANPVDCIWVAAVLMGVQIIDNNFLMPFIVGTKVRLNALAIIIGVLVAGGIGGFPAMFLAIPALAVLKIIFGHVDHLRPWAMLLGDETTMEEEQKNPVRRALYRRRSKRNRGRTSPISR